jgi:hypothetical protein
VEDGDGLFVAVCIDPDATTELDTDPLTDSTLLVDDSDGLVVTIDDID